MPKNIDREEARLPEREYVEEHLPGAINVPLKELNRASASPLDPTIPIVTYCWVYQ